jgi:carboxypeptidase C (cathepsin A)
LFELGPCSVSENGQNTTFNKYSWNDFANILFLDQPVNVGFSYSDDGSKVDRSSVAGEDVYAFYQLFFARFPQYASAKFHMAAESYGGTYAPNTASIFHKKNKELELAPIPGVVKINLVSVILANGITDPLNQMPSIPDFVCEGPYPVYDDPTGPECTALRSKLPLCERLIKACYQFDSKFTCVPGQLYCYGQLLGPLQRK